MPTSPLRSIAFAFILGGVAAAHAAFTPTDLLGDKILAQGKGVEVRQSQLDELFIAYRANLAATGQEFKESERAARQKELLEKLIAVQLCVSRATEADRKTGLVNAQKILDAQLKQAASEEAFNRQLRALGMAPDHFRAQLQNQAIFEEVIEREIGAAHPGTEAEIRAYYAKNPAYFHEPDRLKVSHILFSILDPATGSALPPEQQAEKKRLAEAIDGRAKAGEDFSKLLSEYSDDRLSKTGGGEYIIARAADDPNRAMSAEFESAAFALATNQVSDVVATRYGYHIIKSLERIPAHQIDFATAAPLIRERLLQERIQADLPAYIENLKKEAGVTLLNGAPKE